MFSAKQTSSDRVEQIRQGYSSFPRVHNILRRYEWGSCYLRYDDKIITNISSVSWQIDIIIICILLKHISTSPQGYNIIRGHSIETYLHKGVNKSYRLLVCGGWAFLSAGCCLPVLFCWEDHLVIIPFSNLVSDGVGKMFSTNRACRMCNKPITDEINYTRLYRCITSYKLNCYQ